MVPSIGAGQVDEGRTEILLKGISIPACPEILIDIDRGSFLARRWMLPDFIARGILVHHDYGIFSKPGDLPAEIIAVVATNVLSEHITRADSSLGQESEWVKSADAICEYFDL